MEINKNMRLQGKVAIVTGGGAGIGRGCRTFCAQEGAEVVIAEVDTTENPLPRPFVNGAARLYLFLPMYPVNRRLRQ